MTGHRSWLSNQFIGAAAGTTVGAAGVYIWPLWSHLNFVPGTTADARIVAAVGLAVGLLGEEVLRRRYRARIKRALAGIAIGILFIIFFVGYNEYVVTATLAGNVTGIWVRIQQALLAVTSFLWGVFWSVVGWSTWVHLFPEQGSRPAS